MTAEDYREKGIKEGVTVRIVPIDSVPNATREFKIDGFTKDGFLFGLSTTCDGYIMPYRWIKRIRVIKKGAKV